MLAIRLDQEIEERLEHLQDMEDYYLAVEASQNPGKLYSPEQVKRELGL